ncbi:TlpA family protein disulfide reductase [Myceligenerans pegani]|uniref:TlpA family protein disulfide reductase n=1 Tax=Myceligenerans pegani TaxID=2776917 RepID=A0ABR9MUP1_9MICO|nr:TlpA disulfide reductase family protein [Myceligenerans sp. TRM 65318]MBE1874613.1 TlpA family protein disulfide reductase [Myceligenerans sp. TRM 65318]MBE3016884.1 TlpA family protein disulfide reductase [Myceligenerans sp. TRM 65318]
MIASALFLAGCAAGTTAGTEAGDGTGSSPESQGGTEAPTGTGTDSGTASGDDAGAGSETRVDTAAWDFSAETLEGGTFDGASIAGTPTVLWFWAPWCPTCRAQIPTVTSLAEEYDGEVEFVGAGGLASDAEIRELAGDIPHVTHLIDVDGDVWEKFGVTAQSTFAVIDENGEIVAEGYLDTGALTDLVADLAG